jgi:osmotically-inducible protein OsmY
MHRVCGTLSVVFLTLLCCAVLAVGQQAQPIPPNNKTVQTQSNSAGQEADETLSPQSQDRLVREVRHQLIMVPYYSVFDNLAFRVEGRTVILEGQVARQIVKSDAEYAVKRIEGVEKVVNNIEVLPPSSLDDRLRRAIYRSIYSYGPLFTYGGMAVPPIHIIVENGHVTLEGMVDSEADKNAAGIRAKLVPGTLQVTNNLRVVPSAGKKGKKDKKDKKE